MTDAATLAGRVSADRDLVRERFTHLLEAELPRAHRLAWRLVGGYDAAADDVLQDALLRAHRALPSFRGESALDTWFFRIVVRQAQNHRRWRRLRELWTGAELPDTPAPGPGPGDPALRRRLEHALAALSSAQRDVFLLVHWRASA